MNARQKLLNVFRFNTSGPIPLWDFAYWYDTIQRWYREGLPRRNPVPMERYSNQFIGGDGIGAYDRDVHDYFGFDEGMRGIPVNKRFSPEFEDEGAAEFAERFYHHLRYVGPVEALAEAQRAMMQHDQYHAPFYWASFQLAGAGNFDSIAQIAGF